MPLYANSMNVLNRLHSAASRANLSATIPGVRSPLRKSAFEVHMVTEDGSMRAQWDGDARRPRGQSALGSCAIAREREEEEVTVEEPSIFWG